MFVLKKSAFGGWQDSSAGKITFCKSLNRVNPKPPLYKKSQMWLCATTQCVMHLLHPAARQGSRAHKVGGKNQQWRVVL